MKMKDKKNKEIDTVNTFREIKEKVSKDVYGMTLGKYEELNEPSTGRLLFSRLRFYRFRVGYYASWLGAFAFLIAETPILLFLPLPSMGLRPQ